MIQITHYIDRQFGHPVHIGTEDGVIKFVAPAEINNQNFNDKFSLSLTGQTVEDGNKWLKRQFKPSYMYIKPFSAPLTNKIEDYN